MTMTETVRSLLIGATVAVALAGAAPEPTQARPRTAGTSSDTGSLERIAAVVNDDAISYTDTEARLRLALLSSSLPDNPDIRQRLLPQVLRSLIAERLQLQETKRLKISVSDSDVSSALSRIAEQNRMERQQFEKYLKSNNVPLSTLLNQVKASLAWNKLVQRRLQPQIFISDEEIDAFLDRVRANRGKPEFLTAEIFLAVDSPNQDEDVRRTSEHLVGIMRQGAPFSAVARQFSQAAGANTGGDLGWVQAGQLSDDLNAALMRLMPGQVSPPIRSASGYHILMVRDIRSIDAGDPAQTTVHLLHMSFPFGGGDQSAQVARAQDFTNRVQSCDSFQNEIKASRAGIDHGLIKASSLPPELARMVTALPNGKPSPPLGNDRQLIVFMVCERTSPETSLPSRDLVRANIGNERIEQLQRRYLYDLRRAAYVDVRM